MRKSLCLFVLSVLTAVICAQPIRVGEQLQKLLVAEAAITELYVEPISDSVLVEAAVKAMLKELDPHSTYLDVQDVKESREQLQGNFEGIGIQFNMVKDTLYVVQTIPDGPSEKSGIMPGDRIVSANDTAIAGVNMPESQIMSRLRGPKGSAVRLGVIRHGMDDIIRIDVVRDVIPLNTVAASYMAGEGIGYIKLSSFGATTVRELRDAMAELKKEGMSSLILDLQGNGGGYLVAAIGVANEFLERDNLIVYTDGRTTRRTAYNADGTGKYRKDSLVVLIDEYSASASEIVAGAVQDWDRGTVIGRRSFGKGLVQSPVDFPDGSMMRLTVAKYYTPSGRCIQKPYEDYGNDLAERYASGQLVSADSIHFADSLRYSTLLKHRTVYGGGGIMPDLFVSIDTTHTTAWYREASARGVLLQTGLGYVERYRNRLHRQYRNFESFRLEFEVGDNFLSMLLENAESAGVEYDEEEYQKMLPYVKVQLKGLVARGLWGMDEYYSIVNELNPVYRRALDYLIQDSPGSKLLSFRGSQGETWVV